MRVEGSGIIGRVSDARGVDVENPGDNARVLRVDEQLSEMQVTVNRDGRVLEIEPFGATGRDGRAPACCGPCTIVCSRS